MAAAVKRKGSWWEQPEFLNVAIVAVFAFLHKLHKRKAKKQS